RLGIELDLNTEAPNGLLRLNKRASDIMVTDNAKLKRNFRFFTVSNRRWHTTIRNGYHNICRNLRFASQLFAEVFSRFIYAFTKDDAIRSGKVDVLKNALSVALVLSKSN